MKQFNCKKQVVEATIITEDCQFFVGRNWIEKDVDSCPRTGMQSGEGYDLCKSVCGQKAHAEINALELAGENARGATLMLRGHTYVCEECLEACNAAGIAKIVIINEHPDALKFLENSGESQ